MPRWSATPVRAPIRSCERAPDVQDPGRAAAVGLGQSDHEPGPPDPRQPARQRDQYSPAAAVIEVTGRTEAPRRSSASATRASASRRRHRTTSLRPFTAQRTRPGSPAPGPRPEPGAEGHQQHGGAIAVASEEGEGFNLHGQPPDRSARQPGGGAQAAARHAAAPPAVGSATGIGLIARILPSRTSQPAREPPGGAAGRGLRDLRGLHVPRRPAGAAGAQAGSRALRHPDAGDDRPRALAEVRRNHPDLAELPFVFLSALSDRASVIEGERLGANDYLTKPVDFDLLLATIEARLRQVERAAPARRDKLVRLYTKLGGAAPEPPAAATRRQPRRPRSPTTSRRPPSATTAW